MRRLFGFSVVLLALVVPTTALGATNFFVSGASATAKKGFKPTLVVSKMAVGGDSLTIGFTKTTGTVAARTQTTQSQSWQFQLNTLAGAAHSIAFTTNLGSGRVRSGGKMGTYGSVNLTWTATGSLKTRRPCGAKTVRSRTGRLDGTMRLKAGGGWQTITVSRYQATVTKEVGSCPLPPPPTPSCAPESSLSGNDFANPWFPMISVNQRGGRTSVLAFAGRTVGRAFLSKTITQLVPDTQFTADIPESGVASAQVNIPSTRAISGDVDFDGTTGTMTIQGCKVTLVSTTGATGSGLTARFFGMPAIAIATEPDSNWSADRTVSAA